MDIIVTTPKTQMAAAAQEAAECIRAGGGEYFRRFNGHCAPICLRPGERVWYVEDGFLRGYCTVIRVENCPQGRVCATTARRWPPGVYVFMDATRWKWIRPMPMRGFQNFRYWCQGIAEGHFGKGWRPQIVGGWKDPRP
jgi:hypothetical protein